MIADERVPATAATCEYHALRDVPRLPDDALAGILFGRDAPDPDPRWIRVGLEQLWGEPLVELWRAQGRVVHAAGPGYRVASAGGWEIGCSEPEEREHGGIDRAAAAAYRALSERRGGAGAPHVLRIWNYLDAINAGDGDDERYRRFCVGRGLGMADPDHRVPPAATAIGRRDGERRLQVYWLASATPGTALENPRQTSAWRYPREYGPVAPRFSRAMRIGRLLLVSGTASVVGHATRHADDLASQLDETLENLRAIVRASGARRELQEQGALLKIYLRDPTHAALVRDVLAARLPRATVVALAADVCRRDLLVEIDCVTELD